MAEIDNVRERVYNMNMSNWAQTWRYIVCVRESVRSIKTYRERGGEGNIEIERAWPAMRSKEWGRLGRIDLDRQSA